jgi:hypothetical protein
VKIVGLGVVDKELRMGEVDDAGEKVVWGVRFLSFTSTLLTHFTTSS